MSLHLGLLVRSSRCGFLHPSHYFSSTQGLRAYDNRSRRLIVCLIASTGLYRLVRRVRRALCALCFVLLSLCFKGEAPPKVTVRMHYRIVLYLKSPLTLLNTKNIKGYMHGFYLTSLIPLSIFITYINERVHYVETSSRISRLRNIY